MIREEIECWFICPIESCLNPYVLIFIANWTVILYICFQSIDSVFLKEKIWDLPSFFFNGHDLGLKVGYPNFDDIEPSYPVSIGIRHAGRSPVSDTIII